MESSAETAATIVAGARVIAVVGASPNPNRPSYMVMRYLIESGFEVIPVRPKVSEIMERPCYANLEEISGEPGNIDVVVVFRKPESCPEVARSAVAAGARSLWLQEGIVSEESAAIAREAGVNVIMDRCIKKVHQQINP